MMVASANQTTARRHAGSWYGSLPALLWIALWFSINTGPHMLRRPPANWLQAAHAARAALPLVVLILAGLAAQTRRRAPWIAPSLRLWTVYGLLGLAAGLMWPSSLRRPDLFSPVYWALAYLAVPAAARLFLNDPDGLTQVSRLNRLSWIISTLFFVTLVLMARGALIEGRGLEASGYGVTSRVTSVAGMPMSRASGVARFAAVPGILAFVMVCKRRGAGRWLWTIPLAASLAIVYVMQSRGATVSMLAAMLFALFAGGPQRRHLGVFLVLGLALALGFNLIPQEIMDHLLRRETVARAGLLTGRHRAWQAAIGPILQSPIWGWGFQADRLLIAEHVHNTHLYALLTAGLVGGGAFMLGYWKAWTALFDVLSSGIARRLGQEMVLLQAGGVLTFFTVRSMTEVCGSMFGVDFMLLLPAVAYLETLQRETRCAVGSHAVHPKGTSR